MAIPSYHRPDELLATLGSTNEIAPIDRYVLGNKLAKVIRQARTESHPENKSQPRLIINETVLEIHL
jgi:hypothetical protein